MASARSDGNTAAAARALRERLDGSLIDLRNYRIAPFDYSGQYPADDQYLTLMRTILDHDHLILASPVYWYSMSGGMKNFLDRFTDLLTHQKDTGRQLRGRRLGVLSCANDEEINETFYGAFRLTAGYLSMKYGPEIHSWVEGEDVAFSERTIWV
jgi:multimeric flavodoxin WrbA